MQRPDEQKRQKIIDTAARLFATRPFHEVRLEDVATAATVGKGTLYVYFNSKEDLYWSAIRDGLSNLQAQVSQEVEQAVNAEQALERIVRRLAGFAFAHPEFFELIRRTADTQANEHLLRQHAELRQLILAVLKRGVREGIWYDPHPELTAVFIPGFVRSAIMYGPSGTTEELLVQHILRLLRTGLNKREPR